MPETKTIESEHETGMIALVPDEESLKKLAVDGGDEADQLHMTLLYLGSNDLYDDEAQECILNAIQLKTSLDIDYFEASEAIGANDQEIDKDLESVLCADSSRIEEPIEGKAFAHASFNPDSEEFDQCATYLISDLPENLIEFRDLLDALNRSDDKRLPWIPHITAGFNFDPRDLDYTGPVKFNKIRVCFGEKQTDFEIGVKRV